jgi:AcrR family transcriptional regulator
MSPRTQEANDAIHEERRKTILDTALGVFVKKGYDGTRMQEIADRCALSYGLVYHYFPTKETVFTTLVDMALAAAKSLIQSLPHGSPPQAFGALVGFAVSDPSPLYFALIVEALTKQNVPPELTTRARKTVIGIKDAFAAAGNEDAAGHSDARAESILAILLGASIMKICSLSDGTFASPAAVILAASGGE